MKNHKFFEKAIKRKRIFKGQAVDFWVDEVRLPNGKRAVREYLGHPGAVAVIPLVDASKQNPKILFVRQFRYPVNQLTYELPAGKLVKGENPVSCIHRELEEETGFKARSVKKLISFCPTSAFSNEVIHLYTAKGLSRGRFNPDEDEFIEPVVMTLQKALHKIKNGEIRDSKTIIGLLAFARWSSL